MINRCIYCDDISPDFSDVCDSCFELESELHDELLLDGIFNPDFGEDK